MADKTYLGIREAGDDYCGQFELYDRSTGKRIGAVIDLYIDEPMEGLQTTTVTLYTGDDFIGEQEDVS